MGKMTTERYAGEIGGRSAFLEYTVYTDNLHAEGEEVDVHLYYQNSNGGLAPIGTFILPVEVFDSRWLQRFWQCYQNDTEFRHMANQYYRLAEYADAHATGNLALPGTDSTVLVDEALIEPIQVLNAQGFRTQGCCQGGAQHRAYVEADLLPPELVEVATAAGFLATSKALRVAVPFSQPIRAEAASQAFCRMLNDWARGELQPGGVYGQWIAVRTPSALVRLPGQQPSDVQRVPDVQQIIRSALKGDVHFKDFARLRSGRDDYSRMSIEALISALALADMPATVAALEEAEARKVLRWMCRGLPEGLALRKVAVDRELTERARAKSKLDKVEQSSDASPA